VRDVLLPIDVRNPLTMRKGDRDRDRGQGVGPEVTVLRDACAPQDEETADIAPAYLERVVGVWVEESQILSTSSTKTVSASGSGRGGRGGSEEAG
jgi:hypothetical protein